MSVPLILKINNFEFNRMCLNFKTNLNKKDEPQNRLNLKNSLIHSVYEPYVIHDHLALKLYIYIVVLNYLNIQINQ